MTKKHETAVKGTMICTELNSGRLDWKVRKISAFRSFFLLCDVDVMLKNGASYFSYSKTDAVEIPVGLCYYSNMEPMTGAVASRANDRFAGIHRRGGA